MSMLKLVILYHNLTPKPLNMKRLLIPIAFIAFSLSATSCRETETKEVVREVEVEVETSADKPGILERAATEVDKEINEEIDKKIDKIGNDD